MSVLAVPAAGYSATVANFQWEYTAGKIYGERNVGTTNYGAFFRQKTGVVQRRQQVRFVNADAIIETLRRVSMIAGRKGLPVTFTPDEVNDPGTSWVLDWPLQLTFKQTLDGRRELEVAMVEQA